MPQEKVVADIIRTSPSWRLNVMVTPSLLLVNGAPVGRIVEGRLTDQGEGPVYAPLLDAILEEYSRRSEEPYTEIQIYVDPKVPKNLARLLTETAESAAVAPVFVIPYDFSPSSCEYSPPTQETEHKKVLKIKGTVLIRVEKDRVLVDGQEVVVLKDGLVPPEAMDGFILVPLYRALVKAKRSIPKDAVPVLHVTVDSSPSVVKMVLFTAGKAGFGVVRTFRVLP